MSTAISVRLPDKLVVALNYVAETTERPKSFVIRKALEAYIEEQADLQIALDRFKDTSDSVISIEEIRHEIGL